MGGSLITVKECSGPLSAACLCVCYNGGHNSSANHTVGFFVVTEKRKKIIHKQKSDSRDLFSS